MQGKTVRVLAVLALAAILVGVVSIYSWLISYGTWSLSGNGLRGEAFDSLGRHLLHLDASVDRATIDWEGLTSGTRTVMYFGPFPALLRIVPDLLAPAMYGLWSRLSCLLAAVLALAATVAIARSALTVGGRRLDRRALTYLAATTVGFGLGTPLAFLVSCPSIYHEAIMWALCGSLWGVAFLVRLENGQTSPRRGLAGLAVSFAVTLLSRITFAIPIALAVAIVSVRTLARPTAGVGRARALLLLGLAVSPAVAGGAFQLWYSYDRFGSFLGTTHINSYVHAEEIGGTFNLRRLPSALKNYFGLTRDSMPSPFPLFRLARVHYADDALFFSWKEETLSLTLGSSWLLFGAALGAVALLHRPRRVWTIAFVLCFGVQVVIISAYYFVTERFASEYLPALMLLYSVHLASPPKTRVACRVLPPLVAFLALLSAVVTVGATLQWNQAVNGDVPVEYKTRLARLLYPRGGPQDDHAALVPIGDLQPVAQHATFAPIQRNTTWDGLPIVFKGIYYDKGLGMHSTGRATYAVPSGATAFWSVVGLPDTTVRCDKGSVVFELRDQADRVLYRSPTIRTGGEPEHVEVRLGSVTLLTLVVNDAGDGPDCDHAAWGAPSFILSPR